MQNITVDSFEFFLEEEKSNDDEIAHASETVSFLGIGSVNNQKSISC